MDALDLRSPNTGKTFARLPVTPSEELARSLDALEAAAAPFGVDERAATLQAIARALRDARGELARAIVTEVGKTPAEADAEVAYAAEFVDVAAALVGVAGDARQPMPGRIVQRAPLGVALLIAPYNDPLAGLTRKIAPALAAGCPVLVKPSPLGWHVARTFASALDALAAHRVRFAFVAQAAVIARLIDSPAVGVVSFTGSTATGRSVGAIAGARPIPAVLELGGNCPFVVLADADPVVAARDFLDRKLRAAGQACSSVTRLFVHASLQRAFLDELERSAAQRACGPSDAAGVAYGPVRTAELAARLDHLEAQECAAGARVALRGPVMSGPVMSGPGMSSPVKRGAERGHFRPLSVVLRTAPGGILDVEESFGPLAALEAFTDESALLERLKANRQRLAAYVYGASAGALLERFGTLRFGSVGLNTTRIQRADIPTGGFLDAGLGREGGEWGVAAFQTTVNVAHG